MFEECRHIKANGLRCKSPMLRGQPYCYFHARLHSLARASKSSPNKPIKLPAPEDSASIQLALAQVFNQLAASPLDSRRAGLILYGLQIASQHVQRNAFVNIDNIVQSFTRSRQGDELAPRLANCEDIKDCNDCPARYDCNDARGVEPEDEQPEAENESADDAPHQEAAENASGGGSEAGVKDAA